MRKPDEESADARGKPRPMQKGVEGLTIRDVRENH